MKSAFNWKTWYRLGALVLSLTMVRDVRCQTGDAAENLTIAEVEVLVEVGASDDEIVKVAADLGWPQSFEPNRGNTLISSIHATHPLTATELARRISEIRSDWALSARYMVLDVTTEDGFVVSFLSPKSLKPEVRTQLGLCIEVGSEDGGTWREGRGFFVWKAPLVDPLRAAGETAELIIERAFHHDFVRVGILVEGVKSTPQDVDAVRAIHVRACRDRRTGERGFMIVGVRLDVSARCSWLIGCFVPTRLAGAAIDEWHESIRSILGSIRIRHATDAQR